MKLSDLVKPEKNVRIHTEQQLKEFRRSIEMFGQIRPIVIDENNIILAGNGLFDSLNAMGKETAEVHQDLRSIPPKNCSEYPDYQCPD